MTLLSRPIWNEVERAAWQLPEKLSVSEWCDRHRVLDPMASAEPGAWRTARTPYLREPMDAFADPQVQEITLMMGAQVGKTEAMLNMMGYSIDQDPGPVLYVGARQPDAEKVCELRIQPMVRLSPALARHLRGPQDDIGKKQIIFDRMAVFVSGAGSPAGLASQPIQKLFLDEIDKYPAFSGDESDPVKLSRERTKTFWNRKIVKCSTPTTRAGYIMREYEASDKRRFFVPCPTCGEFQYLVWAQVGFPEDERDPVKIREGQLAWYSCVKCGEKIQDRQKHAMLARGVWAPDICVVDKDGKIIGEIPQTRKRGYWLNVLYSPWVTFSEVAAEFLESKDRPELAMNFWNSWMAEVWEETAQKTDESKILSLQTDFKALEIPPEAVVLTAGIDVQLDHLYYVIRAWGAFEESWLVRAMRVESWDEVEKDVLVQEYEGRDGFRAKVRLACFDSGFRAHEVYDFVRKWKERARATKGLISIAGGAPYIVSRIEKNPRTHAVIPGGLSLFRLDTTFFKDKLSRFINAGEHDRAKWHVHENISAQYARQVTAEHKIVVRNKSKGKAWEEWRLKGSATPNHFLDCEIGAMAAAEMLRVGMLRTEEVAKIRAANVKATGGRAGRPDQVRTRDWDLGMNTDNWMGGR